MCVREIVAGDKIRKLESDYRPRRLDRGATALAGLSSISSVGIWIQGPQAAIRTGFSAMSPSL